jgi:hypothetical protein
MTGGLLSFPKQKLLGNPAIGATGKNGLCQFWLVLDERMFRLE